MIKFIYNSFLLFLILGKAFSAVAQESIKLELKPEANKKYSYNANLIIDQQVQITGWSSLVFNKEENGNFFQKQTIKEMDLFDKQGKQEFSMDAMYDIEDDLFACQQFIKSLSLKSEIDVKGRVMKSCNMDSLLHNYPYSSSIRRDFRNMFSMLNEGIDFFYLNRKLEKGTSFRYKRLFRTIKPRNITFIRISDYGYSDEEVSSDIEDTEPEVTATYTVFDINKEHTILFFNAESSDEISNHSGILVIENSTGLPLYIASVRDVDETFILTAISRDDYKAPAPNMYSSMLDISRFETDSITDILPWGDTSMRYKKADMQKVIDQLEIVGVLDKDYHLSEDSFFNGGSSKPSTKLMIGHRNDSLSFLCKFNSASCMYCNKEVVSINKHFKQQILLDARECNGLLSEVFLGSDCKVEKVVADIDVIGEYGIKEVELTKSDVGKLIKTNYGELLIVDWQENEIILSNTSFNAFNASGKRLTKAKLKEVYPQFKGVSNLLKLQLEDVTAAQAWVYSSLIEGSHIPCFIKMTFEEPVAKIIVHDIEGFVSANKTIEVLNTK